MDTIIVSDVHLGNRRSNEKDFRGLLNYIMSNDEIRGVILNGDIFDMAYAEKEEIENGTTVKKVNEVAETRYVRYNTGNHDIARMDIGLELDGFGEKTFFYSGGKKFLTMHGHQFDRVQIKPVLHYMCRKKKKNGNLIDFLADEQQKGKGLLESCVKYLTGKEVPRVLPRIKICDYSKEEPEKCDYRFRKCFEKKSSKYGLSGGFCGHSHVPYVSRDGRTANSGSWMSNEYHNNTFLALNDGVVSLNQYKDGQVRELNLVRDFPR